MDQQPDRARRLANDDVQMKRALSIFILLCAAAAFGQVPITNNTMLITWGDSYARGEFGNRQNFFLLSHYINKYPQYMIEARDHSRSGVNNVGMANDQMPKYGVPEWGTSHGVTNVWDFIYVSDNGGFTSNQIASAFSDMIQAPTNTYTTNGVLKKDWNQANPLNLFGKVFIGTIAYNRADGDTSARDRNGGGRTVALSNGIPFVETWSNLVYVATNAFAVEPNVLWFNGPSFDHPGNELQLIWALTTLTYPTNAGGLGEDTNIFKTVVDWNGSLVSTNHCTVTLLSQSGGGLTFTFRADRIAPGFYVPDDVVTNDCRGAFVLMPALSNAFQEVMQFTNLPPNRLWNLGVNGSNVVTASSEALATGFNFFTCYKGALWEQKKQTLFLLLDMVNISHATASDRADVSHGNLLIENFESLASARWPTNSGTSDYIALMNDVELTLQAKDVVIHSNAQPQTLTITLTPAASANITTLTIGTLHIGG